MKKLFAVLAMAAIASSALAQDVLPGGKRTLPDVPAQDTILVTSPETRILQVQECFPIPPSGILDNKGNRLDVPLPAGITTSSFCFQGPATPGGAPVPALAFPACRFVGGVLCLDPGSDGLFPSWVNCPNVTVGGVSVATRGVIQGAKLRKLEPRIPKCPDVYPGIDFTQTGRTGIRTFWALKYTPCETVFTLDIEVGCVGIDPRTNRETVLAVRVHRFPFRVVVTPQSFRWVIEALHCQPLGLCEVPCITDEGLFQVLLNQANIIAAQAAAAGAPGPALGTTAQNALRTLNQELDRTEALIIKFCLFTTRVWEFIGDDKGGPFTLHPCVIFERTNQQGAINRPGFIPGNRTIADYGFGIVDTIEHPCCCKLIADIYCLKDTLIGRDP